MLFSVAFFVNWWQGTAHRRTHAYLMSPFVVCGKVWLHLNMFTECMHTQIWTRAWTWTWTSVETYLYIICILTKLFCIYTVIIHMCIYACVNASILQIFSFIILTAMDNYCHAFRLNICTQIFSVIYYAGHRFNLLYFCCYCIYIDAFD